MATYLRAMAIFSNTLEPFADACTNSLYFKVGPGFTNPTGGVNEQAIADDLWAAFSGNNSFGNGHNQLEVRIYSLEDATPRPIRAFKKAAITRPAAGAREVALCLSFKGEGTSPRAKGRIYAGPFESSALVARPSSTVRNALIAAATAFAGIGGPDIDWCVFSPTTYTATQSYGDAFKPVQAAWVDDAWDTQRSRGLAPSARTNLALSE